MVLNTPIPQLILAYEGRWDFAIKTNPFGGESKEDKARREAEEAERKRRRAAKLSRFNLAKLEMRQKMKDRKANG